MTAKAPSRPLPKLVLKLPAPPAPFRAPASLLPLPPSFKAKSHVRPEQKSAPVAIQIKQASAGSLKLKRVPSPASRVLPALAPSQPAPIALPTNDLIKVGAL